MKFRSAAFACLLVAASVGGAKTLAAASPDCARWIKEYQQGLSRRAVLGKKHVVRAAHHIGIPHPLLRRASAPSGRVRPPKLSPAEMLKRFKVLCGEDLPDEVLPVAFVPTGLEDAMLPAEDVPNGDEISRLTGPPVLFTPTGSGGSPTGGQPTSPTNGGGTTNGGFPNTPILPVPPPIPPVSPVPEPSTVVLLLTGLGVIAFIAQLRRRNRAT